MTTYNFIRREYIWEGGKGRERGRGRTERDGRDKRHQCIILIEHSGTFVAYKDVKTL